MSSTLQSSCSSKHNINDARIFCVIGWRLPSAIADPEARQEASAQKADELAALFGY